MLEQIQAALNRINAAAVRTVADGRGDALQPILTDLESLAEDAENVLTPPVLDDPPDESPAV